MGRRDRMLRAAAALLALLASSFTLEAALAQVVRPAVRAQPSGDGFSTEELLENGHRFFGGVSRGLALTVREAGRRWGEPNGYILGQEGSGAFFGGLRYGEGTLFTRRGAKLGVFWQGPSIGFDVGGEGARTMMLVYNLNGRDSLRHRFVGVDGSAYVVGGFGMTAVVAGDVVVVPIRSGVGARLGVNLGYLKFTEQPTWNPF